MARQQATRAEILALAAEGWRFRKKKRKGSLYISARKEKKEKGLGPYSDQVWAMIENIRNLAIKPESPIEPTHTRPIVDGGDDPLLVLVEDIHRKMRRYKSIHCLQVGVDGFCSYWRLKEPLEPSGKVIDPRDLDYLFKKVGQGSDEPEAWAVKSIPIICSDCPAFVDEKMLNLILQRGKGRRANQGAHSGLG